MEKATGWISLPMASLRTNVHEVSGRANNGHANKDFALKETQHAGNRKYSMSGAVRYRKLWFKAAECKLVHTLDPAQ